MTSLDDLRKLFREYAGDMEFYEQDYSGEGVFLVARFKSYLESGFWREMNELARSSGGEYSSVARGWRWSTRVKEEPSYKVKLEEMEREKTEDVIVDELGLTNGSLQQRVQAPPKKVEEGFHYLLMEDVLLPAVKLRQSIDEDYVAELCESVKGKGILQPILVRPLDSGKYEVVAGEQRFRAAEKAEFLEVPCIVKKMTDLEAFEAGLVENLQRRDLSDYEVARALNRLLTKFPEEYPNQKVLAYKLGKSDKWVSEYLAIMEFEEKIPAREIYQITHTQAREIRSAPKERRDAIIKEIAETGKIPSSRDIEARGIKEAPSTRARFPCQTCSHDSREGGTCRRQHLYVDGEKGLICDYEDKALPEAALIDEVVARVKILEQAPPTTSKKGPYWCDWCKSDKQEFQVRLHPVDKVKVCNFCGRPIEAVLKVDGESGEDISPPRGTVSPKAVEPEASPPPKSEPKIPPVHFRERMRVGVSNAEHKLFQYLLKAYQDDRLKARPFLNDDHSYYYIVRATVPDIGFVGVEAPLYLHGEVHDLEDPWDDAAADAVRRQGGEPQIHYYKGQLGDERCMEIGEEVIEKVNGLVK